MSTSVRVAMVSLHTSPASQPGTGDAGGLNVSILGVAGELARRGATVDLLTRAAGQPGHRELSPGVTLHELAAGPPRMLAKEELAEVTDAFGEAVAALTGRRAPRYDVIHAHYWLSGLAVLPVALELGLPLVQSFHTVAAMKNAAIKNAAMKNAAIPAASTAEPDRRLRTEMFLANQATAIVAGSAAEATALVDLARAPIDRVWVVPPGVDLDLFAPQRAASASTRIRAELGIDADIPLIAVVGRIQPLKDQELAIRALALAKPGPVMVIAGEPTPGDDAYLRSLRGLGGDVRFVGALTREGIADLLAAASLTILPSRSETFGIVALESAASGTPVLAYRGSGMRESVADGISGELVNSREPADWAASIDRLLGDPRRLDALGVSARHHAEPYTWAAAATSLLALYESFRE